MAQSLGTQAIGTIGGRDRISPALWQLRLALGGIMAFAAVVGLFAVSWDIQWHGAVGRDRTLTAPHLFILGSITVLGLAALAAVLIETLWARRNAAVAQRGIAFAGLFSGSLGAYLVGYGALDAAIAFPLDQYWHTLFGVDVTIWAPFHIMALTGLCVSCLGSAYMLADGAHLAEQQGANGSAHAGLIGVAVALATLMGILSLVLLPSLSEGFVSIGGLLFTVYPLMLGAFGACVLGAATRALPWRAAATSVAALYLLIGGVTYILVPQLMTLLLAIEQQRLLPRAPKISVVAVQWQYWLLLVAVFLDMTAWLAQRGGWSLRQTQRAICIAASAGVTLASLFYSQFLSSVQVAANPLFFRRGSAGGRALGGSASAPGALPHGNVVQIVVISLALGLVGAVVGSWFGAQIGESLGSETR